MTEEKKKRKKKEEPIEEALEREEVESLLAELEKEAEEKEEAEAEDGEGQLRNMPMIPLRGLSIFPYMVLHFDIGREKSISALEKAMMMNQQVFLSAQKDADTDLPTHDDFYKVGTIAKIKQMLKLPGDAIRVLVEGVSRGEIQEMIFEVPYFKAVVKKIDETEYIEFSPRIVALMRTALSSFEEYLDLNPKASSDIFPSVASVEQPGRLADIITSHLDIKTDEKQKILEAFDPEARLEILGDILTKEIEILNIEQDINIKVRSQINKVQREYYLKEQMRAIQEELGHDEAIEDEIEQWLS